MGGAGLELQRRARRAGQVEMYTGLSIYPLVSVAIGCMGVYRYSSISIYGYPQTSTATYEVNIEWAILSC